MVELKTKNKKINIFSYDSVTLLCNYCDIVYICTSIGCMFSLLKLHGSSWIWTLAYPITYPNALPLYYQTYVKKTVQALYILDYIN